MPDNSELDGAALLRARYGGPGVETPLPLNPVLRVLLGHRSIRHFASDPLPEGALEMLVAAAQSAATSSNLQTFSLVAVQDKARKARLAALSNRQRFIEEAPLFLCWIADLSRLSRTGAAQGRELPGLDYLEAFIVASVDAALAAQNLAVGAKSLGLGTVYVGALRSEPEAVAAELALPPGAVALFGMSIGYPAAGVQAEVKPRLPQSLVLHHERYSPVDEQQAVGEYDARLAEFSRRNGMGDTAWTPRVMARIGSIAAMGGRDQMRPTLNGLGFPLK